MTANGAMTMLFDTPAAFRAQERRSLALFGMSGVGKTRIASIVRDDGWFHYSVDYRIGTRYMGEHIVDNFKREAMKSPLLRELLMSDSIYIGSNITFENLSPLSTYLGKPGDPEKGGIPFDEYMRRQAEHRAAEIAAMQDTNPFIDRAQSVYGYRHFLCDTSGSLCEVVEPDDPEDAVMKPLSERSMILYIREEADHADELARRFDRDPKPMYYNPGFLTDAWQRYLVETGNAPEAVDPDAFIRWAYRELLAWRAPRYRAVAARWGYTATMAEIAAVRDEADFLDLTEAVIARRLGEGVTS